MKNHHSLIIERQVQALNSLNDAIPLLFKDAMPTDALHNIIANKLFSPSEDEAMAYWFARFITLRHNLWTIVDTALHNTADIQPFYGNQDWRYFVLGYSAVCSLIRLDRFLLRSCFITFLV